MFCFPANSSVAVILFPGSQNRGYRLGRLHCEGPGYWMRNEENAAALHDAVERILG